MKRLQILVITEVVVLALIVLIAVCVAVGSLDELSIRIYLGRAVDAFHADLWDDALAGMGYCMDKKPDYAPPFEAAGYMYLVKGDLDSAEETYKTALEGAGEKATPASVLGLALVEALRAAEKRDGTALRNAARDIEGMKDRLEESDVLVSVAAIKTFAGDHAGARRTLKMLEDEEGTYAKGALPVLYNTKGILAYEDNRKEDSMSFLRKAARLSGPWHTPQANLSAMSVSTVSAEQTTKEVLNNLVPELLSTDTSAFTDEQSYLYHNTLGVISYMRLGKKSFKRSLEQFDKAIRIKPDEPWAKLNKATILTLQGESLEGPREKEKLFREAGRLYREVQKKPGLDDDARYIVLNALGILSAGKGSEKEALEYLQKAFEMRPDDYLACRNLGSLHCRLEHYDPARQYLSRSRGLRPGQEDVEAALEVLEVGPEIESASVRYTEEAKPVVGVKIVVRSCPTTVEHCAIRITFDRVGGYFRARPGGVTCVPAADLAEGRHKLNVAVTDPAGNESVRSFDLSVDRSPPKAEGVTPPGEGKVKGPNPEITVRVYDELSDVDLSTLAIKYMTYMTGPEMSTMVSRDVIRNGRYCYDMPGLNIRKDQAVSSGTIRFTGKSELVPGSYRLQVEVNDVLGHKARARWNFSVTE